MAKKQNPNKNASDRLLDAVAEIVHQGFGRLLDVMELRQAFDGWRPNCSMNYEYVFAWKPEQGDLDSFEINGDQPDRKILSHIVKRPTRMEKILGGSAMTKAERQAYGLELARIKQEYQSAVEYLDAGINCKWVDLSFLTDSMGREVYILEMGNAAAIEDDDEDSIIDRHEEIWNWKSQPLTIVGPFTSSDDAETWMADNGAFKEVD